MTLIPVVSRNKKDFIGFLNTQMFGTKPKKFGCNVRNQNKTGHGSYLPYTEQSLFYLNVFDIFAFF